MSWLVALLAGLALQSASADCPPPGYERASLEALKDRKFEITDDAVRQALALALMPCLSNSEPALRDGIAFEAYSTWMRAKQLDLTTRTKLLEQLTADLGSGKSDRDGFRQPFAALVLSEVARTDRVDPWLSDVQRAALVGTAASYVSTIEDYRGFDLNDGWRHGVAHGADLLMQLVLNPAIGRPEVDRLLGAVAAQVAPGGEHSYIDGESERLARPVLFAAQRGLYTADEWQVWLSRVSVPAPLSSWEAAFTSRAGLARRHNVHAFIHVLYVNARDSADQNIQALIPGLQTVLKTLR
jgi:hypothetical protein